MTLQVRIDSTRAAERDALIEALVADGALSSARVIEAMRRVPRHRFVPLRFAALAYENEPLPIGYGQTISQPAIVAVMTEALALTGRERVLEIGAGSGYQSAVLALLSREVFTIERISALAERARRTLREIGAHDVHVRAGDGFLGWPEAAPFDRIVVTAAPREIPEVLLAELADGGVLVAPVGSEHGWDQVLLRVTRRSSRLVTEELERVRFVPMLPGVSDHGTPGAEEAP